MKKHFLLAWFTILFCNCVGSPGRWVDVCTWWVAELHPSKVGIFPSAFLLSGGQQGYTWIDIPADILCLVGGRVTHRWESLLVFSAWWPAVLHEDGCPCWSTLFGVWQGDMRAGIPAGLPCLVYGRDTSGWAFLLVFSAWWTAGTHVGRHPCWFSLPGGRQGHT